MSATRVDRSTARRQSRRQALLDAALAVFSERGVAAASVDDIVRAAGSAKGTFYLYFDSKDAIVNAVAEGMVEGVGDALESAATDPALSPARRLLTLGGAMFEVGAGPAERDLIEAFHRPENRAVHDRMSERIVGRLAPTIAGVIADGIAAGEFRVGDPGRAATYVLGAFSALHAAVARPEDLGPALAELNAFVLRGLGYEGEVPA